MKTEPEIFIDQIEFSDSSFSREWNWPEPTPSGSGGKDLSIWSLSSAPPGKHDLSMCPTYEHYWRLQLINILERLRETYGACMVLLSGPLESGELIPVLRCIDDLYEAECAFHLHDARFSGGRGYIHADFEFEYDRGVVQAMLADEDQDYEFTRFSFAFGSKATSKVSKRNDSTSKK